MNIKLSLTEKNMEVRFYDFVKPCDHFSLFIEGKSFEVTTIEGNERKCLSYPEDGQAAIDLAEHLLERFERMFMPGMIADEARKRMEKASKEAQATFGKDLFDPMQYVLAYRELPDGDIDIVCINDDEEWGDITSHITGVMTKPDEIVLDHNVLSTSSKTFVNGKPFVDALCEYISTDCMEVRFGGFDTLTRVVKLKPEWKSLCVPQSDIYGEEA